MSDNKNYRINFREVTIFDQIRITFKKLSDHVKKEKNNFFTLTFIILNLTSLFYQLVIFKGINFSHYILIILVIIFSFFIFL